MRQLILYLPLLILLALGAVLWFGLEQGPAGAGGGRVGVALPDFSLPALDDGRLLGREQLPAGPLLLNLWASWCHSCLIEHPQLTRIAATGISVIGINYRDRREDALAWLERAGDPYRLNIADRDGRLALELGATGAPETWLVDASGSIRLHHLGVLDQRVWQQQFLPLLGEPAK